MKDSIRNTFARMANDLSRSEGKLEVVKLRDVGRLFHLEDERNRAKRVGRFGKAQNCGRFRRGVVQLQEEKGRKRKIRISELRS